MLKCLDCLKLLSPNNVYDSASSHAKNCDKPGERKRRIVEVLDSDDESPELERAVEPRSPATRSMCKPKSGTQQTMGKFTVSKAAQEQVNMHLAKYIYTYSDSDMLSED